MTEPVSLFRAPAKQVRVGGVPVIAMYGPVQGGLVVNPRTAEDQGIPSVEVLFIDVVNPAALGITETTFALQPGQSYFLPANQTTNVSVNAATSGHRFSAVVSQPPVPYPPTPQPGPFPPSGPTSLSAAIPSYLYQQYADDDDLQAFVRAFNDLAQQYVDRFNEINLPVYTGAPIAGALLDWVAQGLYGLVRPVLSSGKNRDLGPFNTYLLNSLPFDGRKVIGPQDVTVTNDDVFKRCITWNFWKGDGNVFDVRWLKRRIMRFALGVNGAAPNVEQTYQVSVTFGIANQVNITLVTGTRRLTGGAIFGSYLLNSKAFDQSETVFQATTVFPYAKVLKEAIESGALQLPFQFEYVVTI